MRDALAKRIAVLEQRDAAGSRMMHFIKATDAADADQQMVELAAAGKVGPRDGFLSLTGWREVR